MTVGIILAIIFLVLILNIGVKHLYNGFVKKQLGMMHKWLGVILIIAAALHIILTWDLLKQRPFLMYVLGFIMIVAAIAGALSYVFRRQLKKKWFVLHRLSAVVIFICLVIHMILGFSSLSEYKSMVADIEISDVDLMNVRDGAYIGEYNVGYIYAKVEVQVKNGQIQNIELLEHRTERGKPAEVIVDKMVEQQSVTVDAVSGATNSSKVIMKAVENALRKE